MKFHTKVSANIHPQTTLPDSSVSLFVKNVLTLENDENKKTVLPFYADGYPGIMYQVTENGLYVQPQNKELPLLFLYGQTIHPIELRIDPASVRQVTGVSY